MQLICNRPSDSWENAKKGELEKMAKGQGQGERAKGPPTLSLLLSSTFVFLRSPFRATVHYPLSTVHYAWNRLVHSGPENFFSNADARDLQMSIQEHLTSLKAHTLAATIPDLALVKRHFVFLFPVLLQRKVFGDLFLIMVFHRRSKRVKMFFTMYRLYKHDSNTSKRTCILIHNYLKEKTCKNKKCSNQLILVIPVLNLTYLCLLTDASINKTHHCTSLKFVFVGLGH